MQPIKLNLGIPSYRSPHPELVCSLVRLLLAERDRIGQFIMPMNMYVDTARNQIARVTADNALATHLLWIDDDHVFGGDVFARLLAHDVDVVGALYFKKRPPFDAVAGFFGPSGAGGPAPHCYKPLDHLPTGLARVDVMGLGMTLMRADLLRQMRDHFGDEKWFSSEGGSGEDLHFFDRCRQMGVPVHLDGSLVIGHMADMCVSDAHWKATHDPQALSGPDPESPQGYRTHFEPLYEEAVRRLSDHRPVTVVEVGSYLGRSAILLADLLLMSGKEARLVCVDHFRGSDDDPAINPESALRHRAAAQRGGGSFRAEFEKNLEEARVRRYIEVVEGDSADSAGHFPDGSVDFAFLDASHDEASVRRDVLAWLPKVRPGGVLAGDDFTWPGVRAAVRALLPAARPYAPSQWWYDVPVAA